MEGYIFQIQNMSVNDGDGIRTDLFLAGCPLHCAWCSNPECHTLDNHFVRKVSAEEVIREIHSQEIFYRFSGGGVTFTGGEATVQQDFLRELTDRLYDEGYHLALETCGFFSLEEVRDILMKMDTIFMDIKQMDPGLHRKFTGQGNARILENIMKVADLGKELVIRVPTIVGVNADDRSMQAVFDFIRTCVPDAALEFLPFHRFAEVKYTDLGLPLPDPSFQCPSDRQLERWKRQAEEQGVRVVSYR